MNTQHITHIDFSACNFRLRRRQTLRQIANYLILYSQIVDIFIIKWIKSRSLLNLVSSSPRIRSDWSEDALNLTEKNFKRLLLPQQLVSASWVSSASSSS
ncbi:unnamed protein product [Arctia plantaginis]|uniref:Uncharacterized protein n=1 Tax=Arctia plantaginis TaxID=874455 RepID=A0A8S0YSM9_ARCPL|nr:unnamed protein product [Arctia plantaginis]